MTSRYHLLAGRLSQPERGTQRPEGIEILFSARLLFGLDDRFEIEHPDAHPFDLPLSATRQEIIIRQIVSNSAKNIQGTESSDQEVVPPCRKPRLVRLDSPARRISICRPDLPEGSNEPANVFLGVPVEDVQIESRDRRSPKDGGDASYDNGFHLVPGQHLEDFERLGWLERLRWVVHGAVSPCC